MKTYFLVVALAVLPFLFVTVTANPGRGQRDRDVMGGQIPVKKSPTSLLTNVTASILDLSKNKGCRGSRCRSRGHEVDADAERDDDEEYQGTGRGRGRGRGRYEEDEYSEEMDPCDEPRDSGDCNGRRVRWYFDSRDGSCRRFIFSGCGGNSNNFRSRRRCEEACSGDDSMDDDYYR